MSTTFGRSDDVGVHVVVLLRGAQRPGQRHPLHVLEPVAQNLVGALGDDPGGIGVGRAAVGRVVLEAAVARRVVRRRDDDAVGQVGVAAAVERQDRVADRRRRGVPVGRIDHRHNVIGGQHLQRRHPGGLGQPVRVAADEQRAGGALRGAVLDDRLGGRQDVVLVERAVQARAPVPRRAERHLLVDVVGIGQHGVVVGDEVGQVDQVFGLRRLPGTRIGCHGTDSALTGLPVSGGRPDAVHTLRRVRSRQPGTGGRLRRRRAGHRRPRRAGNPGRSRPRALAVADVRGQHRRGLPARLLQHAPAGTASAVELPPPAAGHRVVRRPDDLLDDAGRDAAHAGASPLRPGHQLHRGEFDRRVRRGAPRHGRWCGGHGCAHECRGVGGSIRHRRVRCGGPLRGRPRGGPAHGATVPVRHAGGQPVRARCCWASSAG